MAAFPITRMFNFMSTGGMADVIDARAIGSLARFTAILATVAIGSLARFTRGYFISDFVRMSVVVMVILAFEGAIL
jgi:hypothetical protein